MPNPERNLSLAFMDDSHLRILYYTKVTPDHPWSYMKAKEYVQALQRGYCNGLELEWEPETTTFEFLETVTQYSPDFSHVFLRHKILPDHVFKCSQPIPASTPSMRRIQSATLIGTILRIMDNSSTEHLAAFSVAKYFKQMLSIGYSKSFFTKALKFVCNKNDHISDHRNSCALFLQQTILPQLWPAESKATDDLVVTIIMLYWATLKIESNTVIRWQIRCSPKFLDLHSLSASNWPYSYQDAYNLPECLRVCIITYA